MIITQSKRLFSYKRDKPGQLKCDIDLSQLFDTEKELIAFENKWPDFLASDPYNKHVYRLDGNTLLYSSEELIPTKIDKRPPLLLLLGNPASHSIVSGMFFSF